MELLCFLVHSQYASTVLLSLQYAHVLLHMHVFALRNNYNTSVKQTNCFHYDKKVSINHSFSFLHSLHEL